MENLRNAPLPPNPGPFPAESMKVTCEREKLREALAVINTVVPARGTKPILSRTSSWSRPRTPSSWPAPTSR